MDARRQSPDRLERYWTWPWQTRALFTFGSLPTFAQAIEPCAGAGWMVDVVDVNEKTEETVDTTTGEIIERVKVAAQDVPSVQH